MEAISFMNSTTYGTNMSGWNVTEKGPVPGQIMADLEDGLWFGDRKLPPRPDIHADLGKMPCRFVLSALDCVDLAACLLRVRYDSVTALVKGKGGDLFTLKGANAQTGPLNLIYNGSRPSVTCKQGGKVVPCDPAVHGYNPMKLQGAIIMGRSLNAVLAVQFDQYWAHLVFTIINVYALAGTGGDNSHGSQGTFFEVSKHLD